MNRIPRRLVGRLAALLTGLGAVASTTGKLLSGTPLTMESLATPLLSLGAAIALWFAPWERLGYAGTLGFMWLSFGAIFFGDLYSGEPPYTEEIPVFLVTLFAWNGLANHRWSSLKFAPVALAVMALPGLLIGSREVFSFAVGLTIPMCVFVGELVSWVSSQLITAEEERKLADIKADFLTAASHELRTPLTSVMGYARLLEARIDRLSADEVQEFSGRILENTERLESLVSQLIDVDKVVEEAGGEDDPIGLLAAHYRGEGAEDVQPETLTRRDPT